MSTRKRTVTVRLDADESDKIDAIAEQYGLSASDALRAALRAYRPSAKSVAGIVRPQGAAARDADEVRESGRKGGNAKAKKAKAKAAKEGKR